MPCTSYCLRIFLMCLGRRAKAPTNCAVSPLRVTCTNRVFYCLASEHQCGLRKRETFAVPHWRPEAFISFIPLRFVHLFVASSPNSEKTDVDSTHSSNLSNFPEKVMAGAASAGSSASTSSGAGSAVIPPDALYATSEKQHNHHQRANNMIIASKYYNSSSNDAMFNDSKVRPAAMAAEESFV